MVSAPGSTYMRPALIEANTVHAGSSQPSRAEAVSDIAHRLDVFLRELAAQSPDIDVDDVAPRIEAESPDVREQLVPGAHLVRTAREMPEEQELPLRQRRTPSVHVQHAPVQVQLHGADREPTTGAGWRRLPRQSGIHPRQQLGNGEGFGEIVDRPPAQALHLRLYVSNGGQDEHPGHDG